MDVVLNHMAPNSAILTESNTFNNINRPDLKPAIVTDVYLQVLNHYAVANDMSVEETMDQVKTIVNDLHLYEFEQIADEEAQGSSGEHFDIDYDKIAILNGKRNGATLNLEYV